MEKNFRSLTFQLDMEISYGYEVTKAIVNVHYLEKKLKCDKTRSS